MDIEFDDFGPLSPHTECGITVNRSKTAKTEETDLLTEIYPVDDSLFPDEHLLGVLYLVDCHACTSS